MVIGILERLIIRWHNVSEYDGTTSSMVTLSWVQQGVGLEWLGRDVSGCFRTCLRPGSQSVPVPTRTVDLGCLVAGM